MGWVSVEGGGTGGKEGKVKTVWGKGGSWWEKRSGNLERITKVRNLQMKYFFSETRKIEFHLRTKSLYIHSFALDSPLLWENFPGSVGGPLGWKLAQINSSAFVHQVSESATTRRAPWLPQFKPPGSVSTLWVPVDTLSPPTHFTHSQWNCGHMATTYSHSCLQLD